MAGADDLALLRKLITEPREASWLEFKQNKAEPSMIGEYLSALSNSAVLDGRARAYMVWGVHDDSHVFTGTTFDPFTLRVGNEDLVPWLTRMLDPHIHFEFRPVDVSPGCRVWILAITAARSRPIAFAGIEYIRIGSQKHKLKSYPEHERRLWKAFETESFESGTASDRASDNEVLQLLDHAAYYELLGLDLPTTRTGYFEQFERDGLIVKGSVGWSITNVGAVLFARDLSDFPGVARKLVRVVEYGGNSRIETIHEQRGTRGYANGFSGLIDYINSRLPRREQIGPALRENLPLYPELAIRELVANMMIHQDFSIGGTGPMIELFADRVEITNPGVPLVDIRRFVDLPPRSRNEAIAGMMTRVGVSEERGSGWDKIANLAEEHKLQAPDITTSDVSTRVTLRSPKPFSKLTKQERIQAIYLHAVWNTVSGGHTSNSSLRERFGIEAKNSAQVSRLLGEAVDAGVLILDEGSPGPKNRRYLPFWASAESS